MLNQSYQEVTFKTQWKNHCKILWNVVKLKALCFSFLVSGHVVATQAAVDAVLSAAKEESKQTRSGEESVEGEPQEKRQALEVDLSSLVKEAVFDGQQV